MSGTILVTGANRGIGLEFVKQYSDDGWAVIATCRSPANATELNQLANKPNNKITIFKFNANNISDVSDLKTAIGNIPIDILINNAGVYGNGAANFGELAPDLWSETFLVNTIAPIKIMEALVDNVTSSQHKKMAVLSSKMGSIADNTSGGSYAYRSSKAALNATIKSAAIDLAPKGIAVIALHPGWLKTDMGGENAIHDVDNNVSKLREVIQQITASDSGKFLNYDGDELPW